MNYWKTILIEIKCFASNFFHGWLPSCILWLLLVNFPILGGGRLTKHNQGFIYLHKMIYNLCEAMLITHVARPLCLCPCVDRQAAFHQPRDGKQLWGETNLAVRPASVTERPHERNWQHSFGPGLGQQEYVYMCVCMCVRVRLVSAYFMVVCENRKLWLAFTWFTWELAGWPTQSPTAHLNDFSFFFSFHVWENSLSFDLYVG